MPNLKLTWEEFVAHAVTDIQQNSSLAPITLGKPVFKHNYGYGEVGGHYDFPDHVEFEITD